MRWRVSPSPPAMPPLYGLSMQVGCGRGGFELPAAVLTDKGWEPSLLCWRSPHPRWLVSTCVGHHHLTMSWQNWTSLWPSSSRAKVQHPLTSDWWRQVHGKLPSFCTKAAEMSTLVRATRSTGRDRPLAEVWEQRARNLWNHIWNWL